MPEGQKAIERALSAARRGVAHPEVCVFCKKPLVVVGEDTVWYVHCPCGKSSATFKGL